MSILCKIFGHKEFIGVCLRCAKGRPNLPQFNGIVTSGSPENIKRAQELAGIGNKVHSGIQLETDPFNPLNSKKP